MEENSTETDALIRKKPVPSVGKHSEHDADAEDRHADVQDEIVFQSVSLLLFTPLVSQMTQCLFEKNREFSVGSRLFPRGVDSRGC